MFQDCCSGLFLLHPALLLLHQCTVENRIRPKLQWKYLLSFRSVFTSISLCTILNLYHLSSSNPGRSNQVLPSVPMLVVRWKVLSWLQEKRAGSLWPISQQFPSTLANLKISRIRLDFEKDLTFTSTSISKCGPQCSIDPTRLFLLTLMPSPWTNIWWMSSSGSGVMDKPAYQILKNGALIFYYYYKFLPSEFASKCKFLMRTSAAQ